MWVVVMFDLPVVEKAERKAATGFRNTLLNMGFEMAQFSVYMRFCTSQMQIDTYCKRVEAALPEGGRVNILPSPTSNTSASFLITEKPNNRPRNHPTSSICSEKTLDFVRQKRQKPTYESVGYVTWKST
jgi:CRISPR-associated endonuclease Cas2